MARIASDRAAVIGLERDELLAAAAVLVAEVLLLALIIVLRLQWGVWVAGHLVIVGWFVFRCSTAHRPGGDMSARALIVLTALIGGPFGAAIALVALQVWGRRTVRPDLLDAWYDRIALAGDIDDVTRLTDTVAMGRAVGTSPDVPRPFADVMLMGSLADRQAALGLIARRFSPAYAPALQAALVTSEPMVRVQAAAVATRVRAELKSQIASEIAQGSRLSRANGSQCAEAASRIRALLSTSMLEDDDRAAAESEIARLVTEAAQAPPPADPAVREELESELLKLGDFASFRAVRAAAILAAADQSGAAYA